MTDSNNLTQGNVSFLQILKELWKLLPQISFSAEKGSYHKGKSVCVLVDKRPGSQPDTFDAGLTVFPLTDQSLELADIGIATTGSVEGLPNVRPLRRGVTNKRGCITLKDLPIGQYHLYLANSVVSPQTPLPLPQRTSSDARNSVRSREADYSSPRYKRAAGFTTDAPQLPLYEKYEADDGSLSCFLRETRGGELVLDFEASPLEEGGDLWVEYVIVEQDSERVVLIEQQGQQTELAGRIVLRPDKRGRYAARLSLGRNISLPNPCSLRAYPVPGPSPEDEQDDGQD